MQAGGEIAWSPLMIYLLRWTGLGKLISFYKYFALNAPWTTTAAGMLLLGGIAATALSHAGSKIRARNDA